jgi:hypothetical protein
MHPGEYRSEKCDSGGLVTSGRRGLKRFNLRGDVRQAEELEGLPSQPTVKASDLLRGQDM